MASSSMQARSLGSRSRMARRTSEFPIEPWLSYHSDIGFIGKICVSPPAGLEISGILSGTSLAASIVRSNTSPISSGLLAVKVPLGAKFVRPVVQPILHRRNRRDLPHVANIDPGKASLGRPGFREDAGLHDIQPLRARFWTNRIGCRKMYSMSGARCNDRLMFTFVAFAASCRIGYDLPECVQRGSSTGVTAVENRTCPGIPTFHKALRSFAGYRCHLIATKTSESGQTQRHLRYVQAVDGIWTPTRSPWRPARSNIDRRSRRKGDAERPCSHSRQHRLSDQAKN